MTQLSAAKQAERALARQHDEEVRPAVERLIGQYRRGLLTSTELAVGILEAQTAQSLGRIVDMPR